MPKRSCRSTTLFKVSKKFSKNWIFVFQEKKRNQEIDKEFFAIISSLKEPSQSYRGFYV